MRLNIAMIGTGFIARAHANAFHQAGRFFSLPFELATKVVCGRDPSRLEAFRRQWGWEEGLTDWEAAISRPDIQIVDIAVPNRLHAPIAIRAARAGKIVFCEKPLALTAAEGKAMAEAARGRPTLVWFNYRRSPAVRFAKQLIEEGRLGRIFHFRSYYFNQSGADPTKASTWRYRRSEAGSGAISDLLSHSFDMALYLNSNILELSALAHTFVSGREVDDAVMLMARFANGSLGSFEASRFGIGRRNGMGFEIYGERGSLAFDQEDMNRLRFFDRSDGASLQAARELLVTGPDHPYSANFWKPGHIIGYEHTFIATVADFLLALAEDKPFHPDFDDALRTQELIEAIESSAASGRWQSA
ncbi:MAG: Gfo/Idh/MocA family oxidoreductase [Acidobacteria bacterium]|nr:Gfo/Idh/MocA family oxidoreductase [Acidobacteriota bacterium]